MCYMMNLLLCMIVCFITESWLNNCVPDSLLDPRAQYAVIRNDRQCGNGGDVYRVCVCQQKVALPSC